MHEQEKTGVLDLLKRWLWKEVPHPGGDIVTCVVCACASLLGAIGCYALFVFGGFGETGCFFMVFGLVLLLGQIPKQIFRAYALMALESGRKVYNEQKVVIYVLAGVIVYAPWLFPAYGALKAFHEIHFKCVIKERASPFDCIPYPDVRDHLKTLDPTHHLSSLRLRVKGNGSESRRVSLQDYFINCRTMNGFSLSAYRKVYRLHFDGDPQAERYTQSQIKDAQLSGEISAALKRDDYEEASRLVNQISNADLQRALERAVSTAKHRKMDDEMKGILERKFKNEIFPRIESK